MVQPKGVRLGGRQKGTPNKVTTSAKEAIQRVFDELGGNEGLLAWCREKADNKSVFYERIYPKLLPHQIEGSLKIDPLQVKD